MFKLPKLRRKPKNGKRVGNWVSTGPDGKQWNSGTKDYAAAKKKLRALYEAHDPAVETGSAPELAPESAPATVQEIPELPVDEGDPDDAATDDVADLLDAGREAVELAGGEVPSTVDEVPESTPEPAPALTPEGAAAPVGAGGDTPAATGTGEGPKVDLFSPKLVSEMMKGAASLKYCQWLMDAGYMPPLDDMPELNFEGGALSLNPGTMLGAAREHREKVHAAALGFLPTLEAHPLVALPVAEALYGVALRAASKPMTPEQRREYAAAKAEAEKQKPQPIGPADASPPKSQDVPAERQAVTPRSGDDGGIVLEPR